MLCVCVGGGEIRMFIHFSHQSVIVHFYASQFTFTLFRDVIRLVNLNVQCSMLCAAGDI
jgi:hypothetical protein